MYVCVCVCVLHYISTFWGSLSDDISYLLSVKLNGSSSPLHIMAY